MRVLIIDDHREWREMLFHALSLFGWEVLQAEDGEAAIQILIKENRMIDAILLDQIMPGLNGLQLLPKFLEINPQMPVIMMTSYGSIPLVTEFMQQGGSGFIEKPTSNFQILKLRIEEAIQQARRKQEMEELRAAQQAMVMLNRHKDLFLANLGHELRSPLTAILNYANLAKRRLTEERSEEAMAMLDDLLTNKERLLRFVTNVESLARIHIGEWHNQPVPGDLIPLVQAVVQEIQPRFSQKNLHWQVTGAPTLLACFDASNMRIMLTELLANAGQFSPSGGGVELKVTAAEDQVQVAILDSGPGIPAGEELAIFSPFVESSLTRSEAGGTGLGLAIAYGLAQQHGGTIWAANRPECQGAVITLLLPQGSTSR